MNIKHFINLTNGIEWIDKLMIEPQHLSSIRIQSSHIERKHWVKILQDLDHNFLLSLALGYDCHVYDCGTNRKLSKSIYLGVPFIRYCLNRFWYGIEAQKVIRYARNGNPTTENLANNFASIYTSIFLRDASQEKIQLKRKLKYHGKFLNGQQVNLTGHSVSTSHDGDVEFYKQILLKNRVEEQYV